MEVNRYVFFVDSKYRSSGTNAQPVFNLSTPISLSNPNNAFYAKVLSVEVPFSFNTLSSAYNTVPYTLVTSGSQTINTSGTFTIPPGNYSITTLLDAFTLVINSGFTLAGLLPGNTPSLAFTYNPTTGYASLNFGTMPAGITLALTIRWTAADLLAPFFGFSYLADTVMSCTGGVQTSINVTSPNNVNCSPVTSIMLRSDSITQTYDQQECLVEGFFTPSTILLRVPVNFPFNTWILYENDSFRVKLKNQTLETFDLYFTSLSYDALTFDNVDWRVCLEITEIRDPRYDEDQRIERENAAGIRAALEDLSIQRGELQDDLTRRVKKLRTSVIAK